jgi:hypothetical protein
MAIEGSLLSFTTVNHITLCCLCCLVRVSHGLRKARALGQLQAEPQPGWLPVTACAHNSAQNGLHHCAAITDNESSIISYGRQLC